MRLRATTERSWSALRALTQRTNQRREGLTSGHLGQRTPDAVPANPPPPWIEHAPEASRNMHSTQDSHIPRSEDSGVRQRRNMQHTSYNSIFSQTTAVSPNLYAKVVL